MEYIYGALLLHKIGQPVNEENLKKVIEATGAQVDESKVKTLIASLKGVDIGAELENASVAMSAPAAVAGTSDTEDKAKAEEEKEEKKESESAAGLASLFG
ncbi:MAG: 50S ribosomal protein P1 [Nanoarchaeota archaeon]|nr:50S ribosomal protein P1 [Nanoarchaeota archaeon]